MIRVSYSLVCTNCQTSFHNEGEYAFDKPKEVIQLAKAAGWRIKEKVPNGSYWDFCPRCIAKRGEDLLQEEDLMSRRINAKPNGATNIVVVVAVFLSLIAFAAAPWVWNLVCQR